MGGATQGGCGSCSELRAQMEMEEGGGGGGGEAAFISPSSNASTSSTGKDRLRNECETSSPSTRIHNTPLHVFSYLYQKSRPSSQARPRLPPPEPRTPAPGLQGWRLSSSSKDKIKSFINSLQPSLRDVPLTSVCFGKGTD